MTDEARNGADVGALGWALAALERLRERATGVAAQALCLAGDAPTRAVALTVGRLAELTLGERAQLDAPEGWDAEVLDGEAPSEALLAVVAFWSQGAIRARAEERARILLLEVGLRELTRKSSRRGAHNPVDTLWQQVLDQAQQTGEVAIARLACERLLMVAMGESRSDFAAYLAARLAETAEAAGDAVEGARARLQEARFWEQSGEFEAAFEASQVGLQDACSANDRSLVTRALLSTGRLARRGGGLQVAREAFEGALGALSQGSDSPDLFAHAHFGLATIAAQQERWAEALAHLEQARQHAVEAGHLPLYARAVLAALDMNERLGQPRAELLTIARRDATAAWGLGAATLFEGLAHPSEALDAPLG